MSRQDQRWPVGAEALPNEQTGGGVEEEFRRAEIDFEDYREADGVKLPYAIRRKIPNAGSSEHVTDNLQMGQYLSAVVGLLMLWLLVGAWRLRRKRVTMGAAAGAMMTEMLSKDRRAAIEIILEERTGERDPEDRDGNLPDLERPKG